MFGRDPRGLGSQEIQGIGDFVVGRGAAESRAVARSAIREGQLSEGSSRTIRPASASPQSTTKSLLNSASACGAMIVRVRRAQLSCISGRSNALSSGKGRFRLAKM